MIGHKLMKPEALKAHRKKLKETGICIRCHKRPAREDMATCEFCVKQIYQSKKKRMKGGTVCCYCTQKEVSDGHRMCHDCLVAVRPRKNAYHRAVVQKRRDTGCCARCGILLDEFSQLSGYKTCPTCLSAYTRNKEMRACKY